MRPRSSQGDGLVEMPTSIQAQPHGRLPVLRNILKRRSAANLMRFVRLGRSGDWVDQLGRLSAHVEAHGGVVHLWGHSWEIDAFNQWGRLEAALARLGSLTVRMPALTNGELCRRYGAAAAQGPSGA